MNSRLYRAWCYLYPELDAPAAFAGLQISMRGGIQMVEEQASVRQAILLLLSTRPGERVMRPDYGCDLQKLVFSPNDETTAGMAIHYVRSALARWEPRIQVLRLDANRSESDPGRLDIDLEYRLRTTQQTDGLRLSLQLSGEVS